MQDTAHSTKDRQYHDVIADEYHRLVVDPRKMANDLLFGPLLPDKNVHSYLDLGCGTGHMLARVCSRLQPGKVTAVDHSEGMIREARKIPELSQVGSVQFVHSDLLEFLESADESFDLISCVGVLHHLKVPNIKQVLDRCKQSLSPGGHLLIAEPIDAQTLREFPRWLERWNRKSWAAGLGYSRTAEEPDEHPLPESLLPEAIREAGFKIVAERRGMEVFPRNDPPSVRDRMVAHFAQFMFRKTGYIHGILARVA